MRTSVIIPVYNREDIIDRAVRSIAQQGLGGWEIILVDDASTDDTKEKIIAWENRYPQNIVGIKFDEHSERVVAFNSGLRYARGDWIVFLDSDDELASHFIKAFEQARKRHPNAEIFNWGGVIHWNQKEYERTTVRQPWRPPVEADGTIGVFRSGDIFSGGFAFKKSLADKKGYLSEATNCYTFGERFMKWYPEIKPLYNEGQTDIGNPWGQDYAWFYYLTRGMDEKKVVTLDQLLHIQHVRVA